ncbi:MAG TPA: hypothetical protein O0X39_06195 [Methanocorpusculum sp.]|nr:hypothetical protein [Methanocorpusculum sp.]
MNKEDLQFYLICAVSLILLFLGTVAASGVMLLLNPENLITVFIPVIVFFIGIGSVLFIFFKYRKLN